MTATSMVKKIDLIGWKVVFYAENGVSDRQDVDIGMIATIESDLFRSSDMLDGSDLLGVSESD